MEVRSWGEVVGMKEDDILTRNIVAVMQEVLRLHGGWRDLEVSWRNGGEGKDAL